MCDVGIMSKNYLMMGDINQYDKTYKEMTSSDADPRGTL